MTIMVACAGCGAQLRLRDEYLGRAMACPRCGQRVEPKGSPEAAPVPEPVHVEPNPVEVAAPPIDFPEVLPVGPRPRPEPEFDEQEVRSAGYGAFAPCPRCGSARAERVLWTPWGSFYGPALLKHVRCQGCGCKYNGGSGRSNLWPAIIFVLVPLLLIVGVMLGLLLWLRRSMHF
jgi:DNA-directed RNA polymerase subunit RPC12/RpoP